MFYFSAGMIAVPPIFSRTVHPHISDLINNLDKELQKKCLLYHYDNLPEVQKDTFYGVLKIGDSHTYPD